MGIAAVTFLDMLPWLNLLLLPACGLLVTITKQLATLTAIQGEHGRRLDNLERARA